MRDPYEWGLDLHKRPALRAAFVLGFAACIAALTYAVIADLPGGEQSSAWLGFGVAAAAGALLTIPMRIADQRIHRRDPARADRLARAAVAGGPRLGAGGGMGVAYWVGATLLVVLLGAMFGFLLATGILYRTPVGDE